MRNVPITQDMMSYTFYPQQIDRFGEILDLLHDIVTESVQF